MVHRAPRGRRDKLPGHVVPGPHAPRPAGCHRAAGEPRGRSCPAAVLAAPGRGAAGGGDAERRAALVELEELKRQRNEASRAIGAVKQRGGDAAAAIAAVASLKERAVVLEARLAALEPESAAIEIALPNLP